MRAYLLVVLVTTLACVSLTPLLREVGRRVGAWTPLRDRDVHGRPVPKFGGVAMLAAVLIGLALAGTVPFFSGIFTDPAPVHGLLAALAVVLVVGAVDDLVDLPWWAKLVGQCAAALAVATWLLAGIQLTAAGTGDKVLVLLVVALIFGIVNAIVKPVFTLVTACLVLLTLGLFLLVINAFMLMLTGWLAEQLGVGFRVDGFWSAVGGAVVITVVTWALDALLGTEKRA